MCDNNIKTSDIGTGGNFTVNSYTTTTTTTAWACQSCIHVIEEPCKECGCMKHRCTKLNIIVEPDFYCKHYAVKFTGTTTYPYGKYYWTYTSQQSQYPMD